MRLRNKPWAGEFIAEHSDYAISNPENYKGKWHEVFGNQNPIHIEVGTGKGQFLAGMSQQNPNINYIGIELFDSVIVAAIQKAVDKQLSNFKLLNVNAKNLTEYFDQGEIDRVYLNFSDPWPKTRHAKRRLTYKSFLQMYENVLVKGGEIHFKTDNQGLFEYSLISFSEYGLRLKYISLDLHKSDFEGNVMTEYEEKFSEKGQRIYRVEAKYMNE
ncbi:tRNA (guanosine(46)-N7)-methyltransferase TrmB [Metabacillus litoralis]|uniref:tRNA (guanosine(46)-N7)-methyltransferase TrmB n=1 Tax=Metabacillus TaxID=2675233 RepID=UPI001B969DA2|nr:tRNA (guanosine(46)-N7)-methyltransferase TrmB [Metabacillus litoralis]MCM3162781.1 tRNA (guanosine(46)-N7)-methyltransferase TrmB [Metabacillus litoralis]MCM3410949.1 tRNA (guanosine(46)-N7)-methyltransferase TrmB [Metabacillus litoralis]UHA62171.1 tRNA (guanosine(46)-N7)-methyltransferase TrmB [Metabacillus litoralis]